MKEVAIGGSMTKNRCLTRTLPAVLNMPVSISETTEVSGLGAAVCAAVGGGAYSSLEEGMKAMVSQPRVIEPERLSALEYDEYYQKWLSTARFLEKLSEEKK